MMIASIVGVQRLRAVGRDLAIRLARSANVSVKQFAEMECHAKSKPLERTAFVLALQGMDGGSAGAGGIEGAVAGA